MSLFTVTGEAKLFYRACCKEQDAHIKAQLDKGINPPKINLELDSIKDNYDNNDLAQRDMELIVEELMEVGVVDGV